MGLLRLVLATLVLLSHAGVRVAGYNPGVFAVVVFYLISGYVMAGLIHHHYDAPRHIGSFYADRALRIFPQYLFYMGAALVWQVATGTTTLFLTRSPSAIDLLNNFTVIPLNFFMFNG
jgi:peptidoglycan/LPS O-acetylase OafA/YrhL